MPVGICIGASVAPIWRYPYLSKVDRNLSDHLADTGVMRISRCVGDYQVIYKDGRQNSEEGRLVRLPLLVAV